MSEGIGAERLSEEGKGIKWGKNTDDGVVIAGGKGVGGDKGGQSGRNGGRKRFDFGW